MIFTLLQLEIKSLFRSSQFKSETLTFVMKLFFGLYLALILLGLGASTIKLVKEYFPNQDLLLTISSFYIFYWLYDLLLRFMFGTSPTVNIKPLLILNINKNSVIKYTLSKGYFKIYNLIHLCFFLPLCTLLVVEGYDTFSIFIWGLSLLILLSCNSFVSIFLDKVSSFFYAFIAICTFLGFAQFYGWINIIPVAGPVFYFFYLFNWSVIIALFVLVVCSVLTYKYYTTQFYLDKSFKKEDEQVKSLNLKYLTKLGTIGAFIKNDLYLIIRNKRPRTTVLMSVLFIFYPFLMIKFNGEVQFTMIIVAVFATGGFMISFGQFVPSWDSAYYPLLMSQNISYREYLLSKWYVMVLVTVITFVICSFYIILSPIFLLSITAVTIFNIGFNSNLILLMGAYINQPIDLTSNAGAFGNTKAFNINTLVLSLFIFIVPLLIYSISQYFFNEYVGFFALAAAGAIGFLFRDKMFNVIVKKYQKNKYKMLSDFKK
jgi:hypothetical protein